MTVWKKHWQKGRHEERVMDSLRSSTAHRAVQANAFRSWLAQEHEGWTADLKVDFDRGKSRPSKNAAIAAAVMLASYGFRSVEAFAYTTARGWHLRVWVERIPRCGHRRRITDHQIARVQECLGDDPIRAAFTRERIRRGECGWSILWTSKRKNGRVVSAEVRDDELTEKFRQWLGAPTKEDRFASHFWSRVQKGKVNDCWLWTGAVGGHGYGVAANGVKWQIDTTHRIAFKLTKGQPKNQVLHTCDVRRCCNPRHLYDGTSMQNMQDAIRRGRMRHAFGENSGAAVLTEAKVLLARRLFHHQSMSIASIARKLRCHPVTMHHAIRGRNWKHLPLVPSVVS